jgi:hypothetical protein
MNPETIMAAPSREHDLGTPGWPERLSADGPKRILSIDGGGVRGALALEFLRRLESVLRERHGRPNLVLADYFDLIGGTSVGAILASGLALGRSTDDLTATFDKIAQRLFRGSVRLPLIQARYNPVRLHALLQEELGEVTLGSAPWRTGFACVSKRVDTGSTWILSNSPRSKYWEGDPDEIARQPDPALRITVPNKDYPVAKVVQASAAAPFFFDMIRLEVVSGDAGLFFDGAVTPHGNPVLALAMLAMAPAYGFGWKGGADQLRIVSVGTGLPRPRRPEWVDRRVVALWKALHALISVSYDTGEHGLSVMQWLGESPHPWRINSEIGDLSGARPQGYPPLWTFHRYDAPLESRWLRDNLQLELPAAQLKALARLDDARQIERLQKVGRLAAERQIRPEHFTGAL